MDERLAMRKRGWRVSATSEHSGRTVSERHGARRESLVAAIVQLIQRVVRLVVSQMALRFHSVDRLFCRSLQERAARS